MTKTPIKKNSYEPKVANQIRNDIILEIFKAGKIPNVKALRKLIRWVTRKPVTNFSTFIAQIDKSIEDFGFPKAAKIALESLAGGAGVIGIENIPMEGPVVIASNHPGTYDGFVMISNLPRDDFKLMVSGIPFFKNLPSASKYLIYSTQNITDRVEAIRKAIRYLKSGGALLIYPSGRLDPDPAVLPGAKEALSLWSRSIEVFLKKVPESKLVLVITSGVLSKEFINHPFTKLFKDDHEKRRITEFMQVIKQMVYEKPVDIDPNISFSAPIHFQLHEFGGKATIGKTIFDQSNLLLDSHCRYFLPGDN